MMKMMAGSAALLVAGGYVMGAFGSDYSRTVSRPPTEVLAALEHIDLGAQPGASGSTADAAGGVKPLFRVAREGNRVTWYVMSGDRVATTMTAAVDPSGDGKASVIHTSVARGDAPDDVVSPAFRSTSATKALFAMAIEDGINRLVAPPRASEAACERLLDRFRDEGLAQQMADGERSLGAGARAVMRVNAMGAELRRQGCPVDGEGYAASPMAEAGSDDAPTSIMAAGDEPAGSVRFEPGKPMLDSDPAHR